MEDGRIKLKLLYCLECGSLFNLTLDIKHCSCGKAWGVYNKDKVSTTQTMNSLSIGMANPDFEAAIKNVLDNQEGHTPINSVRTWVNPSNLEDINWIEVKEDS